MTTRQTILITGATDGLGQRTAEMLAGPDTLLLIHGRDRDRGQRVVAAVEAAGGAAMFYRADFAALGAVRELAATLANDHPRLDVLVNNAGIALANGPRRLSDDGHELTFAVNYLAPFLLTHLLRDRLSGQARVINVASAGQSPIDFDNVMLERNYNGMRAYTQSKLANVMFTFDCAEAWPKVTSSCLHPATFMATGMLRAAGIQPINSVDTGARAVIALITKPRADVHGLYFDVRRESRAHAQAYDLDARRRLRDLSLALTGRATT